MVAKKKIEKKMMAKDIIAKIFNNPLISRWSFLIGLILAVVLGAGLLTGYTTILLWIVFVIGIIVGLLNITAEEIQPFLIGGTVFALVSYLGITAAVLPTIIEAVLKGILTLFVPATIIVALKSVFILTKK